MSAAYCPDCLRPVDVPPGARDGRCAACRPVREHSRPRELNGRHAGDRALQKLRHEIGKSR